MQRAFCAGTLMAIAAALVSVYLMLRRQSLIADTLSHISLAGIAIGITFGINPSLTAFVTAICGGAVIEWLRRSYRHYSEVSIALLMTGGLSIAVILMSLNHGLNKGIHAYLFGSLVAVSHEQLLVMGVTTAIVIAYVIRFRRPLYWITFDEQTALSAGFPVRFISFTFSMLVGFVTAIAMPVAGALLVSVLMIVPAALAIRFAKSFAGAIGIAVLSSMLGVNGGLVASYYLDTPPGGTIALILLLLLAFGSLTQVLITQIRKSITISQRQSRRN